MAKWTKNSQKSLKEETNFFGFTWENTLEDIRDFFNDKYNSDETKFIIKEILAYNKKINSLIST